MTENTSLPCVIAPALVIAGTDPQSMPLVSEDDEISLLDILQVVADNLRLLLPGPLVADLLALAFRFTITPAFNAATKFMPLPQSGAAAMLASLGALGGLAGAAGIKSRGLTSMQIF